MSGIVKIELLPIIAMDANFEPLPFKKAWMAEDGLFVIDHHGEDVVLEKEDFLFFGKKVGGRYFSTFELDGTEKEYSFLTGAPTLRKPKGNLKVNVTMGEDLLHVTPAVDVVTEDTDSTPVAPLTEELQAVREFLNEGPGEVDSVIRVSDEAVTDGPTPVGEAVHDPMTLVDKGYGAASLVFGPTEAPLAADGDGAHLLNGVKLFHFDEKGKLVHLRTTKDVVRGSFHTLVHHKSGEPGFPLVNPLNGEVIGTVNHKITSTEDPQAPVHPH